MVYCSCYCCASLPCTPAYQGIITVSNCTTSVCTSDFPISCPASGSIRAEIEYTTNPTYVSPIVYVFPVIIIAAIVGCCAYLCIREYRRRRYVRNGQLFYTLNPVPGGFGPSYPVGHAGFAKQGPPPQYVPNYGQPYPNYSQYPSPNGPLYFNQQQQQWSAGNTNINPQQQQQQWSAGNTNLNPPQQPYSPRSPY